ncbi:anti-phage dCTP deaminase [Luteolibacter sp. SL250]|uniref:anti-phage dCTP deaminase n=1 Tax=Luteolibacter sp. SL250 TaxID=2995170 RepID=UPI00226E3F50|nr:anti-phage dCTP deaminase [Luteolibacter sp. SL250]WAC20622.1 anti-phage dCTP deaminase [Luteolibacter sp. SL250]
MSDISYTLFQESKHPTELVFGLVYPLGIERESLIQALREELSLYGYDLKHIRISSFLASAKSKDPDYNFSGDYLRSRNLMKAGNETRALFSDDILMRLATWEIRQLRKQGVPAKQQGKATSIRKVVYLIDSIKNRAELEFLKGIYANGFYLLALNSPKERRRAFLLTKRGTINEKQALKQVNDLMDLDQDDIDGHGQEVGKVFHLADYFLDGNADVSGIQVRLDRFLRMVFNDPFVTPTFEEYAMHVAYTAATKTADLSRQVGAVVAQNQSILSLGANEVPKFGGGTYWPYTDARGVVLDSPGGRDYKRLYEPNKAEIQDIKLQLFEGLTQAGLIKKTPLALGDDQKKKFNAVIAKTRIDSLTEFGRMLHAEMDALLECAKRGVATADTEMYVTTFPCHNCAKHIIGAGVSRVVYIEPYQKSKAPEFHDDSCEYLDSPGSGTMSERLVFTPFEGLGPRYYMMLFSMMLSPGAEKKRRGEGGKKLIFDKANAVPRLKMLPQNYLQLEEYVLHELESSLEPKAGGSRGARRSKPYLKKGRRHGAQNK